MVHGPGASIMERFRDLADPRMERSKRQQSPDIVAVAISAMLCGADSWVQVEMFGRGKEEWFRTVPDLPHGISSHDTPGDVFSRLDPGGGGLMPGEVVIDGRPVLSEAEGTVRRPHDRAAAEQAVHLVSTWASPELVEGQHADLGTGQDAGESQHHNRHSPVAGNAGTGVERNCPPGVIVLLSTDSVARIEKRPFHPSHRSRPAHCRQRRLFQHSLLSAQWSTFPAPLTEQAMNPHGVPGTAQFRTAQQGCLPTVFQISRLGRS